MIYGDDPGVTAPKGYPLNFAEVVTAVGGDRTTYPLGKTAAGVQASASAMREDRAMTDLLSRDQIISTWEAGMAAVAAAGPAGSSALAATPPPPDADAGAAATPPAVAAPASPPKTPPKPADPAGKAPGEEKADAAVTEAIASAAEAVDRAIAAQKTDPGNDTDPTDKAVSQQLAQLKKLLASLTGAQAADTDETGAAPAPDAPAKPAPPAGNVPAGDPSKMATAPGLAPGNAQGIPGDADDSGPGPGDIEATVACENPNCGHLGGAHADTADGENQGACQMNGCDCPGMIAPADALATDDNKATGDDDETTGGPDNEGGDGPVSAPVKLAAGDPPAPGAPTEAPAMAPPPSSQLPPWDPDPNVATGPEFTIPVAWIEGTPTGETLGRIIDPGALTWRTPPLPFMWLDTSPHDPSGMSPNDPARLAGRIDSIEVVDGVGQAKGHFLSSCSYLAQTLGEMGRMGVSIDVGGAQVAISGAPIEIVGPGGPADFAPGDDEPPPILEHLIAGRIMGITACPFAALEGAYVVLGDGSNVPDAPMPKPTPEAAQMGIRFVDAQPCEPCTKSGLAVTASSGPVGVGPLAPPRGWFDNPGFTRGDSRLKETLDAKTGRPSGKFACPFTVTPDGRVFGHIAQWGVCHQGPRWSQHGQCLLAPRSRTGYAWFHGRGAVLTAEGDELGVGRLTAGTGHAPEDRSWSAARAINHYDHSGFTAAVVRAGEDDFGIWVAGAVTPDATPEQVYKLRTCPPSGDWRPVGAGDELVAVLAVNEPGWPIARASIDATSGRMSALVAAGVPLFEMPTAPEAERVPVTAGGGPLDRVLLGIARRDVKRRMAEARGR
jgi:hypothetical protein